MGKVKERLVYHNYQNWSREELAYAKTWREKIKKEFEMNNWWTDAEILRLTKRPLLQNNKEITYRGYSRMELFYIMDKWLGLLDWNLETKEEKKALNSGNINILGRDVYYRPVLYINVSNITNKPIAKAYNKIISKVLAIARTYMCVPGKCETIWAIIDTDGKNISDNMKFVHHALKPLEYLQAIITNIVWIRPGAMQKVIWSVAEKLGFIETEARVKVLIMDDEQSLLDHLQDNLDLCY